MIEHRRVMNTESPAAQPCQFLPKLLLEIETGNSTKLTCLQGLGLGASRELSGSVCVPAFCPVRDGTVLNFAPGDNK